MKKLELVEASTSSSKASPLKQALIAGGLGAVLILVVVFVLGQVGSKTSNEERPGEESLKSADSDPDSPPAVGAAHEAAVALATPASEPDVLPTAGANPGTAEAGLPGQHSVVPGETLAAIADQYRVSEDALRSVNQLTAEDVVAAGTILLIPGPGAAPSEADGSPPASEVASQIPEDVAPTPELPTPVAEQLASEQIVPPAATPPTETDAQATPGTQSGSIAVPPASQAVPEGEVVKPPIYHGEAPAAPLVPVPSLP